MVTVKMAWDLEEPSFIKVELVTRFAIPLLSRFIHSDLLCTISPLRPSTLIEPFFSSRMCRFLALCPVVLSIGPLSSKSWMSSPYSSKNCTFSVNSLSADCFYRFSNSSKMKSKTRGTIPICSLERPTVLPVPIVWVLPLPVCPYARMVAL